MGARPYTCVLTLGRAVRNAQVAMRLSADGCKCQSWLCSLQLPGLAVGRACPPEARAPADVWSAHGAKRSAIPRPPDWTKAARCG